MKCTTIDTSRLTEKYDEVELDAERERDYSPMSDYDYYRLDDRAGDR